MTSAHTNGLITTSNTLITYTFFTHTPTHPHTHTVLQRESSEPPPGLLPLIFLSLVSPEPHLTLMQDLPIRHSD